MNKLIRRAFLLGLCGGMMAGCNSKKAEPNESDPASNTDGRKYVNYDERTGDATSVPRD